MIIQKATASDKYLTMDSDEISSLVTAITKGSRMIGSHSFFSFSDFIEDLREYERLESPIGDQRNREKSCENKKIVEPTFLIKKINSYKTPVQSDHRNHVSRGNMGIDI